MIHGREKAKQEGKGKGKGEKKDTLSPSLLHPLSLIQIKKIKVFQHLMVFLNRDRSKKAIEVDEKEFRVRHDEKQNKNKNHEKILVS